MIFEWDEAKARKNLRKHGVSFGEAISVFNDPLSATGADPDHSLEEERFVTFGMSWLGRLLFVGHTDRAEVIRIVTTRLATTPERNLYETG